jgi:hypothetical protein
VKVRRFHVVLLYLRTGRRVDLRVRARSTREARSKALAYVCQKYLIPKGRSLSRLVRVIRASPVSEG